MNRKSAPLKALVVAVATPNLAGPAVAAGQTNGELPVPHGKVEIAVEPAPVVVAQRNQIVVKGQTITTDQVRQAVRTELANMTPAQKARLGRTQVDLDILAVEPANATKCWGNVTNGVGCHDPFSGGYLCCIVTLGPPAN